MSRAISRQGSRWSLITFWMHSDVFCSDQTGLDSIICIRHIWCLITIMMKWHRGQWIQDMYIQSQNVRRLYVLPRPQSSQMTDRHTTTENQNKYVTFIYLKKARQLKLCISKVHSPHLLEKIVLGEQVGFGVLAATVVGFQHLHGHAGQAWIIKSLNCTEYQAM